MSYTSNGAARLIFFDKSNNFNMLLATWSNGSGNTKMGAPGGPTHPNDKGNTLETLRRTCGPAFGTFPFSPNLMLKMGTTCTWQSPGGEPPSALWTDWYVYLGNKDELATLMQRHGRNAPKLSIFSRHSVMYSIREGKMVDEAHAKGLLRATLCAKHWGPAMRMWSDAKKTPSRALIFRQADVLANEDYERALEVDGDWRQKLTVEAYL